MSHQCVLGRTFLLTILAINRFFVNMLGVNVFPEIVLHCRAVTAHRALEAAVPQRHHHAVDVIRVQGHA